MAETRTMGIARAMQIIASHGHVVTEQDIPGLYRIDDGHELTANQLISVAASYLPANPFENNLSRP